MLERTEAMDAVYKNPDNDPRGLWRANNLAARNFYSKGTYPITCPSGRVIEGPPPGSYWRVSFDKFKELDADGRIWWGEDGNNIPAPKIFRSEVKQGRVPQTLWFHDEVGHTQDAKKTLIEMGLLSDEKTNTITPKPVSLIERVLEIGADENALLLDSFAGSGTTAHAVLKANAKDGGNRRFILVEGEAYADTLTAERVRRAIHGYAWSGTQRETLLEEKITLTQFKKAAEWLAKVDAIKRAEGLAEEGDGKGDLVDQAVPQSALQKRFDKIEAKMDDGVLRVEGVRRISELAPGLGGGFTYCTLGEAVELEKLLSGEKLPAFDALGAWLFYTATGGALPPAPANAPEWYLGQAQDAHVWLVYQPDLNFLKSPQAALTLSLAERLQTWGRAFDAQRERVPLKHLVFAPAKYLSNQQLKAHGVDYAPLPFALYRES